ncbi:hypothetical protein ACJX0J_007947 [Zea mays]
MDSGNVFYYLYNFFVYHGKNLLYIPVLLNNNLNILIGQKEICMALESFFIYHIIVGLFASVYPSLLSYAVYILNYTTDIFWMLITRAKKSASGHFNLKFSYHIIITGVLVWHLWSLGNCMLPTLAVPTLAYSIATSKGLWGWEQEVGVSQHLWLDP